MTEAPARPLHKRGGTRRPAPDSERRTPAIAQPVEIVAPDRYCTALLLEYATPLFPAEIVADSGWIVRLQPPSGEGGWVLELLALMERWLDSARLPCAKILYGGRTYLIRASNDITRLWPATESAPVPALEYH
jgi:hypothetical protein